jgi:nucleoside-diphosphate-sugar epimerase
MRVHITGSNGFIATHLMSRLSSHVGLSVSDIDFAYDPENVLDDSNSDVVVHLGALVGREFGERDLAETINLNAISTALWAKACADRDIHFVYTSTSEAYGDMHGLDAEEYGEMNLPYNLYGLTKRWGEEAARLYCDPDKLTIARLAMPYGPGLPAGKGRAAIVNFLVDAYQGGKLQVHEGASRSWCWVGDTVDALSLLARTRQAGIYNVGRDDNETAMVDVAIMAMQLVAEHRKEELDMDWALEQIELVPAPANQVLVKRLPTDRIRALGWEPQVDLRHGMAATLAWLVGDATLHHPNPSAPGATL